MRIDRTALADLACGAAFLGSGGGGDPYYARLLAEAELARHGAIGLVALEDLADDALVVPCGWIGAPTVSVEKLPSGRETVAGLRRMERILDRRIDAVMPVEIGGGNGLAPLTAAAQLGVPMVDADGMGRAFPESQMAIFNIRGLSACPSVLTDAGGSLVVVESVDNLAHERIARGVSVAMGGIAHMAEYPLSGRQAREHAIGGSVSAAIAIGAAVRRARGGGGDPFAALFDALRRSGLYARAGVLFDGKIVDLERETRNGFSVGRVAIEGFGEDGGRMLLEFQNENLVARRDGQVRAMVPDLITVMDRETADSITTERLKYGQRVKVVGAAAPPMLREARALDFVGPAAFGFAEGYVPIEALNGWDAGR
ncbi:hypothetical protein B1992_07355 [Pseudoxanthomonas broegbernensis]|uniref:DUF917 domain-containing protein n=1 Tax=Pseudoxanthomonas broegbernensis TaxID=83619 RepID=A0A7V8GMV9_9GAMM|nr:DUF917 domain-containing protein [Pseudoxanthomonas broegbernensis]KAF1686713.1 hypothetical protein B1992_07355 [Pseudoxanthomonas broegbernensis]MBB6063523.1 hypothetical protein [Pseudoxanthomonas broegbernensis]